MGYLIDPEPVFTAGTGPIWHGHSLEPPVPDGGQGISAAVCAQNADATVQTDRHVLISMTEFPLCTSITFPPFTFKALFLGRKDGLLGAPSQASLMIIVETSHKVLFTTALCLCSCILHISMFIRTHHPE